MWSTFNVVGRIVSTLFGIVSIALGIVWILQAFDMAFNTPTVPGGPVSFMVNNHQWAVYGAIAVLIARLLPVIRTFIALPAGIARMPRLKFHIYTFVGSWPWCFMLAYIGLRLGEQWDKDPRLKTWFHRFDAVILAAIVAGMVYFLWSHWQHRVGAEPATEPGRD